MNKKTTKGKMSTSRLSRYFTSVPVIIETPYGSNPEFYSIYAKKCMKDSTERNEAPLASHILYADSGVLDDHQPEERKLGIELGYAWLKKAEYVVFCTDFGWSNGMREALNYCINLDINIVERKIHE